MEISREGNYQSLLYCSQNQLVCNAKNYHTKVLERLSPIDDCFYIYSYSNQVFRKFKWRSH